MSSAASRAAKALSSSQLFDEDYYCVQLNSRPQNPILHYINQGDAAGLRPSPYFDTSFYKQCHPNWAENGALIAFEDFLDRCQQGENCQPHPLIDPDFYTRIYPDLRDYKKGVARHFMLLGDHENRSPSAEFDSDFYRTCYLPLNSNRPLRHYLVSGRQSGFQPRQMARGKAESHDHFARQLKDSKRYLIIAVHDAQPAGVPILALDLAKEARAAGWDVVFLLLRAGPLLSRFRALGETMILAEGWSVGGLATAVSAKTPVVALSAETADLAAELAENGLPVALFLHEPAKYVIERRLVAPLQRVLLARARVIASFKSVAEGLVSGLGSLPILRPETHLPVPGLAAARSAASALAGRNPVFIGAGTGAHRKGFDRFLSAAEKITKRAPAAGFVWLGDLEDWAKDLANATREAGVQLMLPGFVHDAAAWYRCADAYLLTSRHDPGPGTAIHAISLGMPAVCYRGDIGIAELIADFAVFIDPENEDEFVSAALDAAGSTPAERRRRRIAVRSRVGSMSSYFDKVMALIPSDS